MNALERHARKEVLLARIAHGRSELRRDLALVKESAHPQQLLRATVGANPSDWIATGMSWLRRYRVAATIVGTAAPLLGGRGRWSRLLRIGVIVGAGWLGWRVVRDRAAAGDADD